MLATSLIFSTLCEKRAATLKRSGSVGTWLTKWRGVITILNNVVHVVDNVLPHLSRNREDVWRLNHSLIDTNCRVIACFVRETGHILHERIAKLQLDLCTSLWASRACQCLLYGGHHFIVAAKEQIFISNLQNTAAGNNTSLSSCWTCKIITIRTSVEA